LVSNAPKPPWPESENPFLVTFNYARHAGPNGESVGRDGISVDCRGFADDGMRIPIGFLKTATDQGKQLANAAKAE